jgi:uncharacterized membrane protein YhdT
MNSTVEGDRISSGVPRWFLVAAIAVMLFEAMGAAGLVADLMTDKASLPLDQRTLAMARPAWMGIAYGIATSTGLVGAILLMMRHRVAVPLLLVSLIAAAVTFLPYLITPGVRDNIASGDRVAALVVLVLAGASYWLAHLSRRHGWLR